MLLIFTGPSCSGKSTVADLVSSRVGLRVFNGKDYLRLSKSPCDAEMAFVRLLTSTSQIKEWGAGSIIWVTTETGKLFDVVKSLQPLIFVFTAEMETLANRFNQRNPGMPAAVIRTMLEKQSRNLAAVHPVLSFDTAAQPPDMIAQQIIEYCAKTPKPL
jgi:hypothetical protein